MFTTVAVSSQACHNGSQTSVKMLGRSRSGGLSVKQMAWEPFCAQRRTSSAAAAASHSGTRVRGMSRPYASPAHQSSIIQSL